MGFLKAIYFEWYFFLYALTYITDKSWDLSGLSQFKFIFHLCQSQIQSWTVEVRGTFLHGGIQRPGWWSLCHLQSMASTVNSSIQYPTARQRKRKSRGACRKILWARLRRGINHIYILSASTQTSSSNLWQESLENVYQRQRRNRFFFLI